MRLVHNLIDSTLNGLDNQVQVQNPNLQSPNNSLKKPETDVDKLRKFANKFAIDILAIEIGSIVIDKDEFAKGSQGMNEVQKDKLHSTFERQQYHPKDIRYRKGGLTWVSDFDFQIYLMRQLAIIYSRQHLSSIPISRQTSSAIISNKLFSEQFNELKMFISEDCSLPPIEINPEQFLILLDIIFKTIKSDSRRSMVLNDIFDYGLSTYFDKIGPLAVKNYTKSQDILCNEDTNFDTKIYVKEIGSESSNQKKVVFLEVFTDTCAQILKSIEELKLNNNKRKVLAAIFLNLASRHLENQFEVFLPPLKNTALPVAQAVSTPAEDKQLTTVVPNSKDNNAQQIRSPNQQLNSASSNGELLMEEVNPLNEEPALAQSAVPAQLNNAAPAIVTKDVNLPTPTPATLSPLYKQQPSKKRSRVAVISSLDDTDISKNTVEKNDKPVVDVSDPPKDYHNDLQSKLNNAYSIIQQLLDNYEQKINKARKDINNLNKIKYNCVSLYNTILYNNKMIANKVPNLYPLLDSKDLFKILRADQKSLNEYDSNIINRSSEIDKIYKKYPSFDVSKDTFDVAYQAYLQTLKDTQEVFNQQLNECKVVIGDKIKQLCKENKSLDDDYGCKTNELRQAKESLMEAQQKAEKAQKDYTKSEQDFTLKDAKLKSLKLDFDKAALQNDIIIEFNKHYTYKKYTIEHFKLPNATAEIASRWWDGISGIRWLCNKITGEDAISRLKYATKAVKIFNLISAEKKIDINEDNMLFAIKDHVCWPVTKEKCVEYNQKLASFREEQQKIELELQPYSEKMDSYNKTKSELEKIKTEQEKMVTPKLAELQSKLKDLEEKISSDIKKINKITELQKVIEEVHTKACVEEPQLDKIFEETNKLIEPYDQEPPRSCLY